MTDGPVPYAPRFWLAVVLVGVGAGVVGGSLLLLLHLVSALAYGYRDATFLVGVGEAPGWRRFAALLGAGVVAGFGWWLLRGPVSRRLGDAVGETEAVWSTDGRMPLARTLLDGLLQIVVVGLGASLGREGAPRQIAGALSSWLSERSGLSVEQRRLLIACGGGAGLAAVYDVPLGGALFTLEVLLGSLTLPCVLPAALASVLAVVVAWVFVGDRPVYPLAPAPPSASLIVLAVVLAPVAALAAVGFVRLVGWSRRGRPTGWRLPLTTIPVFGVIGALAVVLPELLGNGKAPAELVLEDGGAPVLVLAALVVLKPLATVASLRSGANGGLFTPTLATGAVLGALAGRGWDLLWPGAPPGTPALVGAAGFLAAAMRAPLCTVVLLLELTGLTPGVLVPLTLTAVIATLVARRFGPDSTSTVGLDPDLEGPPEIDAGPQRTKAE